MPVSYRNQIILLVLWIFVVTAMFKLISDRQIAALIAGSGFILLPVVFLISELKHQKNKIHIFTLVLFLGVSAFPIFALRLLNWGVQFDTLSILGVQASFLHKISSYLYMLVLITAVNGFVKQRRAAK
ncbi:MAG: hypothetical protein ABL930_07540 [Pseudobdellovibrio sp.]